MTRLLFGYPDKLIFFGKRDEEKTHCIIKEKEFKHSNTNRSGFVFNLYRPTGMDNQDETRSYYLERVSTDWFK